MKRKQNIEQFFREQEQKLDERPTPRAWDRLEKRLDQFQNQASPQQASQTLQPSRAKRSGRLQPRFGLMRIAASLLLLVGMLTAISILFRPMEKQSAPTASALPTPVMEVLEPHRDQGGVYAIAVNFQRYLNQSPRNLYFAEGIENKKLRSTSKVPGEQTKSDRLPVIAAKRSKEKENRGNTLLFDDNNQKNRSENTTASTLGSEEKRKDTALEPPVELAFDSEADIAITSSQADLAVSYEDTLFAADAFAYDEADYGYGFSEDAVAFEEENIVAPAQKMADLPANAPPSAYNTDVTLLNASRNSIKYNGQGAHIDQFQWLIGQWSESLGAQREIVEEWRQTDAFTIEGKGKLVVNGDTIFTEGMKIQKIDENLYFILALDEQKREVKFRLKSYDTSVAVFETDQPEIMNQVILRQSDFNNFSTTIQNVAPVPQQPQNFQYLQQRNNVELDRQRSSRNLSRVRK